MRAWLVVLVTGSLVLPGCGGPQKTDSKESVQKAIEAYLAQRQNLTLSNMNLEVGEVQFAGETATAEVKFLSKQASGVSVTVQYKLKRSGNTWQVDSTASAAGPGGSPHGGVTPSSPHGGTGLESSH